ncbi:MAG: PsiF repeat protein [Betaproteobacteria bacterium]|nr:PsiF repeat protein [Betaproteobacteria bacterium]
MKKMFAATLIALPLALGIAGPAQAAENQQHARMRECNADAAGKKGDERKAFIQSCLADKKKKQQEKMTACNKDAGDKKGSERKKFMKECLSK